MPTQQDYAEAAVLVADTYKNRPDMQVWRAVGPPGSPPEFHTPARQQHDAWVDSVGKLVGTGKPRPPYPNPAIEAALVREGL